MKKLLLNKNQFSDLLNLHYGVYQPLDHFVNKETFNDILYKKKINKKFFPIPIFFGINRKIYNKIKKSQFLKLYFEKKFLAVIKIKSFFKINHSIFGKKIFKKNFKKHPFYIKFRRENYIFIDFSFKKIIKRNLVDKNFISPNLFKRKTKKLLHKKKYLAGFHTRNVPHKAHQWAHHLMLRKYNDILVQPLIGQYKKNEYVDKTIIETNKKVLNIYKKSNLFFAPLFSYPRYGGPLEAALHALVRKNYGCTHFWVGRDHAGYKKFYSKYESQKFCLKNQKKLGIKIIAEKEPYFCGGCKKIVNKKCSKKNCRLSDKTYISGTKIREYISNNKKIPEHLVDKRISLMLKNKSVLVS